MTDQAAPVVAAPTSPAVLSAEPAVEAPAPAPAREYNSPKIQDGDYLLLVLPSENKRLVQIKANETIELGKFGRFESNALIGRLYNVTYSIGANGALAESSRRTNDAAFEMVVDVPENNNREIYDDNANQKLTNQDIEALRAEKTGDDLINAIISNHTDFDKKTEFSKAKYIKKKREKFLRQFTPTKIDAATLCEYHFEKNPFKIKEMRLDILALLLSSANIRPHARVLVFDDTLGMLTAAILERMGGMGQVVALHETLSQNLNTIRCMNFSPEILDSYVTVPLSRAFPLESEMEAWEAEADKAELRGKPTYRELRNLVLAGGFDALVIATSLEPQSVFNLLSPYVATSRPIVVYHTASNVLVPLYQQLRESPEYIMANLLTTWTRPYQVLPQRTHPVMNMSGHGGALVTAIKVGAETLKSSMNKDDLKRVAKVGRTKQPIGKKRPASTTPSDAPVGEDEASKRARVDSPATSEDASTSTPSAVSAPANVEMADAEQA
ncbi:tRNA (adenine(58)-N(1))-methyltransferase non-catalytic subunit trm6 [Blastocladiella emersonii ATCC 22665]|nr:tRNA (adenine(58)-N(1))-methyltransferase non-catalytic subunit trm6 [Blastocladiella emersonii ATCC 22665]